jgi:ribokinase
MILTFGSINVDLIVPVQNLPQPGETVLGTDYSLLPGGKGANQALAARRAGSEVLLAGAVGSDQFAGVALNLLRRAGVDVHLVRVVELPTGCAAIMVSDTGENAIAVAPGANASVHANQIPDEFLDAKTVLIAQMEVPPAESEMLIRRVRKRGGRCLLNLAPALQFDLGLLPEIDILVANKHEAATLGPDLPQVGRALRQALIVTRGARGAAAFLADGSSLDVPALAVEPVDTTGAGDAFTGVLGAGIDQGFSLAEALRRASVAGALTCLAYGAQSALPDKAAIDRALSSLAIYPTKPR